MPDPLPLTYALLAVAVLLSAWVQGFSGLGFSLIAAPVLTQVIPGSSGIGLVNTLALAQNAWQVSREEGDIHWNVLKRMGPGLLGGVLLGVLALILLPDRLRPLVVAMSSLLSMAVLIWWHPVSTPRTATLSGAWGASVNTYAGVGGPPLAAYLVKQDWDPGSYIRTQQTVFALLNIMSIPLLGLPPLHLQAFAGGIAIVVIGTSLGISVRHRVPPERRKRISQTMVLLVAGIALLRAVVQLFG
jgi:uncharacterized membrane protein YfcA